MCGKVSELWDIGFELKVAFAASTSVFIPKGFLTIAQPLKVGYHEFTVALSPNGTTEYRMS